MIFSDASIASRASGLDRLLPVVLLVAAILLALGLSLPILRVDRFFIFSKPFSIFDSLVALAATGEYFLFSVILCFTVVFPTAKIVWATALWGWIDVSSRRFERTVEILDTLGKWSMLDVMLLAIAIASIKLSLVGDAEANPGLYLFCGAIITAMVGSVWLKSAAKRLRGADEASPSDEQDHPEAEAD